jgi:hypothetical protein
MGGGSAGGLKGGRDELGGVWRGQGVGDDAWLICTWSIHIQYTQYN